MDLSQLKVILQSKDNYIISRATFDDDEWEMAADEMNDWIKSAQEEELDNHKIGLNGLLAEWTGETKPTVVFGKYLDMLGLGDDKGNIIIPVRPS